MPKYFLHTFAVSFTTPRRIEDSLGELVGYNKDDPDHHSRLIRVVVPETGYKNGWAIALAWVKASYDIVAYDNLEIVTRGEVLEVDTVIHTS